MNYPTMMKAISPPPREPGLTWRRGLMHALVLAWILSLHIPLQAKERPQNMPNGTWTIETRPPTEAVRLCSEFLPNGTRLSLVAEGPTRLSIEEERRNELGGTLTLLPPISAALCRSGLGTETGFGTNLCSNTNLTISPDIPIQFTDAVFLLSRLDAAGVADPENDFFVSRGARKGTRFATIFLKDKGIEWRLWLRSADEMISECVAHLPGKNNLDSFPMIWRRQPGS